MGGRANIVSAVAFMSRAKAPEISPFRHAGLVRGMGDGGDGGGKEQKERRLLTG